MVCSLGGGRMAVMARLIAAGSFSQTITEEVGDKKLASQYIHRELCEADEVNLLDEEDMHIFGLKPMVDSLHLVCCNACKKPVKASQYAAHAELCKSLKVTEETILELDGGGTGHNKPPRKERKKLLTSYANHATAIGEQESSEPIEVDDTAASESHLVGKLGMISSFPMEAKRNPASVDAKSVMDGSGASPGSTDNPARMMPPPNKRSKLISGEHLPPSDRIETGSAVLKIISTWEAYTCSNISKGSKSGSTASHPCVVEYKIPWQVHECCLLTTDVPLPLASKIYYSQRNNSLRSALSQLYEVSTTNECCGTLVCTKEHCGDLVGTKMLQENTMPLKDSSPKDSSLEQIDDDLLNKKKETSSSPSVQKSNNILPRSSEVCLGKSGGCLPTRNISSQSSVDDLRPKTAPIGLMRSTYVSKPYSFTGNSGTPLGTMQPPNGSVPVV